MGRGIGGRSVRRAQSASGRVRQQIASTCRMCPKAAEFPEMCMQGSIRKISQGIRWQTWKRCYGVFVHDCSSKLFQTRAWEVVSLTCLSVLVEAIRKDGVDCPCADCLVLTVAVLTVALLTTTC